MNDPIRLAITNKHMFAVTAYAAEPWDALRILADQLKANDDGNTYLVALNYDFNLDDGVDYSVGICAVMEQPDQMGSL